MMRIEAMDLPRSLTPLLMTVALTELRRCRAVVHPADFRCPPIGMYKKLDERRMEEGVQQNWNISSQGIFWRDAESAMNVQSW